MARLARVISQTGLYHIIFRGICRQNIFEELQDYEKMLELIKRVKREFQYDIYAYCLMTNHVHLLIKERNEDLGIVFRRIGAKYVYWYNHKYKRRGYLFQDRYKSEAVESDEYLLTVLRYIHQNPVKAGISKNVRSYPWSSYNEYITKSSLCDTDYITSLFAEDKSKAILLFQQFNAQENNDKCLEYEEPQKIYDDEAIQMIIEISGVKEPHEIQILEPDKRVKVVKELRSIGLSMRQIERLTGLSISTIRRL